MIPKIGYAEAVTTSDTVTMPGVAGHGMATHLYVGGTGDVTIEVHGTNVTFTAMNAGEWHDLPPFARVRATGTTATGLVAGWP